MPLSVYPVQAYRAQKNSKAVITKKKSLHPSHDGSFKKAHVGTQTTVGRENFNFSIKREARFYNITGEVDESVGI